MKKSAITLFTALIILSLHSLKAQDVNARLTEAEKAYQAKNLDDTRFALQGALSEINKAIGLEVLNALPKSLGSMPYIAKDDNTGGVAGIAGVSVSRNFAQDTIMRARVDILGDSPLLTTLNAILSMPAILGSSDPNQKRVKIGGYKSLLKKETGNDNKPVYDLQIPLNQTLITFHTEGIADENTVVTLAEKLPS